MHTIALIIQREYLFRVRKKSFLLLTFLSPFLFAALLFVPLWLAGMQGDEVRTVAILDATHRYAPLFEDTEHYHFLPTDESLQAYREQSKDEEIFAYLSITGDLLAHPNAATLYSDKQVPTDLKRLVERTLSRQLEKDKLATYHIPNLQQILAESRINYQIETVKWSKDGTESNTSALLASVIGMFFTVLIYMFIMIYGAMVMQGVMEEKSNRIIEVMISSVRPFDLMMGKIVGIGLVGLTQMFIWGMMTGVLAAGVALVTGNGIAQETMPAAGWAAGGMPAAGWMASTPTTGMDRQVVEQLLAVNLPEILLLFILYFIGGYMLYAALFAAIGAAVDNQEDTQQFMAPVTALMIFALYAGIYSAENPDGPLAVWCSLIPLTAPIVMMVRLPFDVPFWQILFSLVLLYASFIGMTWLSAKIYRVGILMYGKKASLKEIWRWIR